jgi:general secretion pathway protein G
MRRQRGFTIIELLIVLMIIGILAAIAIPNLIDALNRSRQKRTMADMRTIANAWEARAVELNRYNAAGALEVLATCTEFAEYGDMVAALAPTYAKTVPERDAWGNNFRYGLEYEFGDNNFSTDYVVWAAANDGQFTAQPNHPGGATTKFRDDILFSGGQFLQYPEGMQTQ